MRLTPAARSALIGAAALLVLAELVARLQGDRLCSDRPGVVYERDAALGWRHVPGLAGRLGTCEGDALPAMPTEIDAGGLVGPGRSVSTPPGTARILLLGGNAPEGFGIAQDETMARLLEVYTDERRGDRLEVLNAATGGWAIDNGLAFFRRDGAARAPDLVIVALDPKTDVVSLSPSHLAALGRRVPAKPYFSLVDGRVELTPPFALEPPPPPRSPPGPLAWSALYRLVRGVPAHVGEPMAWALSGTFPHGTVEEERAKSLDLARGILGTFRDEVAAAGGKLVLVVMPLPGAITKDATGRPEREGLTAVAGELGIPLLDLSAQLHAAELRGQLFLPGSLRLTATGHAMVAAFMWSFLREQGLLPPGLVPALVPGGGRRLPHLAEVPGVVAATLWSSRHWLVGGFVQFGLLAACLVWMTAPLPGAARDWVLVALGVGAVAVFGGPAAAAFGLVLALAWYGAVELLPRSAALPVLAILCVALLVAVAWSSTAPPREPWAVATFIAVAANVALLKLIAYAADRRRGAPRLSPRELLAAMLFFPTVAAGPIQAPAAFVASRSAAGMPAIPVLLGALGRVALGWAQFALAPIFLTLQNSDVFVTGGAALGRGRLWLFVAEVAALLSLLLAGWSNVAIGLARLAGASPPENMRRPWLAPSVAEFWRRWHASLSEWFHAYLYEPAGGSRLWGIRNVVAVFVVSAAWHLWAFTNVLGWVNFTRIAWAKVLLWAVLNAGGVIVAHAGAGRLARLGAVGRIAGTAVTAVFVALAWLPIVLPQSSHLRDLVAVYLRLFGVR